MQLISRRARLLILGSASLILIIGGGYRLRRSIVLAGGTSEIRAPRGDTPTKKVDQTGISAEVYTESVPKAETKARPFAEEIRRLFLEGEDFRSGKDILALFKEWGTENPFAAIAFLSSWGDLPEDLSRKYLDKVLAGWVLSTPEEAWGWALAGYSSGPTKRPSLFVSMMSSLAEVGRFEIGVQLIESSMQSTPGLAVIELAKQWARVDAKASGQWVNALPESIVRSNALSGLSSAFAKESPETLLNGLVTMGRRDASRMAGPLLAETKNSPELLQAVVSAVKATDDLRFEDAILDQFIGPATENMKSEYAIELLDSLKTARARSMSASNYVFSVAIASPAAAYEVGKRYLTPDELAAAFARAINRATLRGKDTAPLAAVLQEKDTDLLKAVLPGPGSGR
ncbi:MAG: hypothetical protein RL324_1394 [Verrucomicrobiota bacterium]|jgi:hypothetical protein